MGRHRIGFVGAGIMGSPMVRIPLRAGHPITIHNRTKTKCETPLGEGAAELSVRLM